MAVRIDAGPLPVVKFDPSPSSQAGLFAFGSARRHSKSFDCLEPKKKKKHSHRSGSERSEENTQNSIRAYIIEARLTRVYAFLTA